MPPDPTRNQMGSHAATGTENETEPVLLALQFKLRHPLHDPATASTAMLDSPKFVSTSAVTFSVPLLVGRWKNQRSSSIETLPAHGQFGSESEAPAVVSPHVEPSGSSIA